MNPIISSHTSPFTPANFLEQSQKIQSSEPDRKRRRIELTKPNETPKLEESDFIGSLRTEIEKDAKEGAFSYTGKWKFDVTEKSNKTVSKTITYLNEQGFSAVCRERVGVVEEKQDAPRVAQYLYVGVPIPNVVMVDPQTLPFSARKILILCASKKKENQDPKPSLEEKLQQIFRSLALIAVGNFAVRRWTFHLPPASESTSKAVFHFLKGIGYQTFLDLEPNRVYDSIRKQWTCQTELTIDVPKESPPIPKSPRLEFDGLEQWLKDLVPTLPLTKHLNDEQRLGVYREQISSNQMALFLHRVEFACSWMSEIANDLDEYQKYPKIALRAHLLGRLSKEQVASFCMLYSAIDQLIVNPVYVRAYFRDEHHNYELFHLSSAKVPVRTYCLESIIQQKEIDTMLKTWLKFTDHGISLLKEQMKCVPSSEKFFHTIEVPLGDSISWSPFYKRLSEISDQFFNLFDAENESTKCDSLKYQAILIPSFSLCRAVLQLAYGKDSIDLEPILGTCSESTIEEYKEQGKRVINIGMPGADVPPIADDFYAGKFVFTLHDLYHATRYSQILKGHQLALNRINRLLLGALKTNPPILEEKKLAELRWKLLDGELNLKQSFGSLFSLEHLKWPPYIKTLILKDMFENEDLWRMGFGITVADLSSLEQREFRLMSLEKKYSQEEQKDPN